MNSKEHKRFKAFGMLAHEDIEIDVIQFNEFMAVMTKEMPIMISKQQVMDFFDLVEKGNKS